MRLIAARSVAVPRRPRSLDSTTAPWARSLQIWDGSSWKAVDDPENGTVTRTVAECRRGARLKFRCRRPRGNQPRAVCRSGTLFPPTPTPVAIRGMSPQGEARKGEGARSPDGRNGSLPIAGLSIDPILFRQDIQFGTCLRTVVVLNLSTVSCQLSAGKHYASDGLRSGAFR